MSLDHPEHVLLFGHGLVQDIMTTLSQAATIGIFVAIVGLKTLISGTAGAAGNRSDGCPSAGITGNCANSGAASCAHQTADCGAGCGVFNAAGGA